MNRGSFEHEEEILLFDGQDYQVVSVQEPKYKLYKLNTDIEYGNLGIMKEGTKVIVTNNQQDEIGAIRIRPLEGQFSGRQWDVFPHMIEFIEEVTNLDSTGNPITVITLDVDEDA